jgi:hypothetical protein
MPATEREERLDKREGSILPALANKRVHCTIEARVHCCTERKATNKKDVKFKTLTLSYLLKINSYFYL